MSVSSNLVASYSITDGVIAEIYNLAMAGTPTNVVSLSGTTWYLVPNTGTQVFFFEIGTNTLTKTFNNGAGQNFKNIEDIGNNLNFATCDDNGVSFDLRIWDQSAADGNTTPVLIKTFNSDNPIKLAKSNDPTKIYVNFGT